MTTVQAFKIHCMLTDVSYFLPQEKSEVPEQ